MDFLKRAGFAVFEAGLMPDVALRVGVRQLCQQRLDECRLGGDVEAQQAKLMNWIEHLKNSEIALLTEAANEQHYELVRIFSTREWLCGYYRGVVWCALVCAGRMVVVATSWRSACVPFRRASLCDF